ncbi:DUF4145 domain-containing protein [Amycolatopsis keratiniphila]|uniref:DUF4145 domain-containing protein n=1 Tax=Amycolatopsis keratiniphila TaxID=129921 RepID=UPI00340D8C7E
MVHKLIPLADWFPADSWPLLACPDCSSGITIDRQRISQFETFESEESHGHEDFEPLWVHGHFHGQVNCGNSRCQLRIVVVGDFKVDYADGRGRIEYLGQQWDEYYKLKFTHPPMAIMSRAEGVPDEVWSLVTDASRLAWVDPAAASGRLRAALESLMDSFKITKLKPNRKPRNLHDRLKDFETKKPDAAQFFLAVKWVGNEGAHGNRGLTSVDVLESAELMEHGFQLLYNKSAQLLQKRAAAINKARRLPRTRTKK